MDVAGGEDQPGNVNSGAPSRQIGEQNREDGKSNEDSSEPQVSSSPQVEAPGAAEEGEWSREGTEADPDEEMSFDEEDFFSEFSQTDDAGGSQKGDQNPDWRSVGIEDGVKVTVVMMVRMLE
ncbi:hypothetical protein SKAU_G00275100 [Synaphobranchus kaupii]|uniref:Uncharacterized protein n=1 Tax=Synaphobranchus kaupii TaxID=118154 RepID=A0A9Q1F134_SYNKA|nr:hypothetical protein SKAU_G00275100 [Synaphobranchus kaupii]